MRNEESLICPKCSRETPGMMRFCGFCGFQLTASDDFKKPIYKFLFAFFSLAIYVLSLHFFKPVLPPPFNLIFDFAFLIITLILLLVFYSESRQALNLDISLKKLLKYLFLQLFITLSVSILYIFLMSIFDFKKRNIFTGYEALDYPVVIAIVSIALFPAITEEIGFRGILFGQLERMTSEIATVLGIAFLFAIIHFNILGFIWLFPAGIFLGWVRLREKTIWYSSACHFLHNGFVVIDDRFELINQFNNFIK